MKYKYCADLRAHHTKYQTRDKENKNGLIYGSTKDITFRSISMGPFQ
jgi:hypothetical protein